MKSIDEMQYLGRKRPEGADDREVIEMLLDQILEETDIPVSKEAVEEELFFEVQGLLQSMRYRAMGGDTSLEDLDLDQWKEDNYREILREHKIELVLGTIIDRENITVTSEELKAEAEALALRENTSLEMVRGFLGSDFGLLRKDLLRAKARRLILETAIS